jgi:transcriptional regulator with XRE-family HTH domain
MTKLATLQCSWHPTSELLQTMRLSDILNGRIMESSDVENDVSRRIQLLRKRCGLSIRQLAKLAGVTAAIISCIERGKNSPSIATLQKILSALGTNLAAFFAEEKQEEEGPVYLREHMRAISDGDRTYTIVLGKHPGVGVEVFDETIRPTKRKPPFEVLQCDVAGYILSGHLALEVQKHSKQVLRPGDAFHIPLGTQHRGFAVEDEPVRLITVYHPSRY